MKKILIKINNFIQWTKQWHFFHVFFIGSASPFIFICTIFTFKLFSNIKSIELTGIIENIAEFFVLTSISVFYFSTILLLPCFLIEVVYFCINTKYRKQPTIFSNFWYTNKYYNYLFVLSCLINVFCNIVVISVFLIYPTISEFLKYLLILIFH